MNTYSATPGSYQTGSVHWVRPFPVSAWPRIWPALRLELARGRSPCSSPPTQGSFCQSCWRSSSCQCPASPWYQAPILFSFLLIFTWKWPPHQPLQGVQEATRRRVWRRRRRRWAGGSMLLCKAWVRGSGRLPQPILIPKGTIFISVTVIKRRNIHEQSLKTYLVMVFSRSTCFHHWRTLWRLLPFSTDTSTWSESAACTMYIVHTMDLQWWQWYM